MWHSVCDVTARTMAANASQHSDESRESLDLMMEAGSSSLEKIEDFVPPGTQPYLFEPRNLTSNPPQSQQTKTDWETAIGICLKALLSIYFADISFSLLYTILFY